MGRAMTGPSPIVVLYSKPGCGLCDETRELLVALLAERARPRPRRPADRGARHHDRRGLGVGVLPRDPGRRDRRAAAGPGDLGGEAPPPARPRRSTACPRERRSSTTSSGGTDLTILVAVAAGVISFLSPCVLPLVPAYLGQLTAVAVAGRARAEPARRAGSRSATRRRTWPASGSSSPLLGVTATFAGRWALPAPAAAPPGRRDRPHRHGPQPRRDPPHRRPRARLAAARGRRLGRPGHDDRHRRVRRAGGGDGSVGRTSRLDRLGGRLVGRRGGYAASFGLGAIFAIGWTPCVGHRPGRRS